MVSHPTVAAQEDPSILELHSHRGGRANSWHTDVTFDVRPPKLSILRAVTLPELDGDTGGPTRWLSTITCQTTSKRWPTSCGPYMATISTTPPAGWSCCMTILPGNTVGNMPRRCSRQWLCRRALAC
nr:TauD/TfdA family dioxygenase [Verminephrobacter eiseniae]